MDMRATRNVMERITAEMAVPRPYAKDIGEGEADPKAVFQLVFM